jgi:hypothetical protein
MKFCISLVIVSSLLAAAQSVAQESFPEMPDFTDSVITEEQWRKRVDDARRQSEEFVATLRSRRSDPGQFDEEDVKIADQRAMNDPTLERGDIIATSTGLLVFIGQKDGKRQKTDFLPASVRQSR